MRSPKPQTRRCAVYTRKSSEEGLEQDFNSLHAQREACEAFIKSQHGEGWRLVAAAYDDGGLSGGTMERPALQRLLADIRDGKIDIVVVYKVDRLTRSLADFAKMVEVFDAHGVSFVAVTQQFNTTSSMGRLTLNILLSFAQFEREVTGERIRDKIAASKRKGMWMGGHAPLGYDVQERKLVINQAEAETVRMIFRRYQELGCVRRLKQDLDRRGVVSKSRVAKNKRRSGGCSFSRGALYTLLANPIYIGEIRHKHVCHPGQHEPIVDRDLWDAVQQQLQRNASERKQRVQKVGVSLLTGKLFDSSGERLTPSHAVKSGRRYRYYVSAALVRGATEHGPGWRLPARELEQAVAMAIGKILADRGAVATALSAAGIVGEGLASSVDAANALAIRLALDKDLLSVASILDRVELTPAGLIVTVALGALVAGGCSGMNLPAPVLTQSVAMKIRRRGLEMRLVIDGAERSAPVDPALAKTIARAHRWFDDLAMGRAMSTSEIAAREGVTPRYVTLLLPLACLDPTVIEAVAHGTQPVELTAQILIGLGALPLDWDSQRRLLGLA